MDQNYNDMNTALLIIVCGFITIILVLLWRFLLWLWRDVSKDLKTISNGVHNLPGGNKQQIQ